MSQSQSTPDLAARLREAYARRDELVKSLLAINGGDPNLYAAVGRNEGYDSLLCTLRGEEAVIEELRGPQDTDVKG